jgi:adenosylmethionine-8-amino-7-oxononanoate aminotransferase
MLNKQIYAPRPVCRFHEQWDQNDLNAMEDLLETHQHEVAAVIIEPIVQGAGGMWFYHPEYLRQLRQLCDRYSVLLIFDEIATGFARTGELFAMDHAGVVPDILCIGKALTGGTMTMAAIMTTMNVANTINQSEAGVFMHGPTFMANPLACAVAHASIRLLLDSDWQGNIQRMQHIMREELAPASMINGVADVRVLGAIGVIETWAPVDRARLCDAFVRRGVWVRPFNRYVYIMPPYIMQDDDLTHLCRSMVETLAENLA